MKLNLSAKEKAKLIGLYLVIILVTIGGFVASAIIGKSYVLLAGLALAAYLFGLRHAVDADHIAAIDNTTRKLIHDGKRPFTVGTWFSLGHSTIVVLLIVAFIFATRQVSAALPSLQSIGSVIGTLISGVFLWIIGLINAAIVLEIYSIFRRMQKEEISERELEKLLLKRGFMSRYFSGLFNAIKEPIQIYPVGLLFGLGFDTASEVALIAISVGIGISSSVPAWMILVLPLMFACGMVLIDTTDGVAMSLAYGWAFLKPMRKIYYNLTITIISVAVAILIGSVELLQVISQELSLSNGIWGVINGLDFETIGFWIIGLFILSWIVAIAIYQIKGYEKKKIRK